jgi:ribosome-associated protein
MKRAGPKKKASKPKAKKKPLPKKKIAPKKAAARKILKAGHAKTPAKKRHGIPETLRDTALKVLDSRQAEDVVTVDLTGRSSIADYLIIASGRNARQIMAIADYLREAFHKHGMKNIRVEGRPEGNWVLVDSGDVIVHLFRPEVRRYYNLESIWDENLDRGRFSRTDD